MNEKKQRNLEGRMTGALFSAMCCAAFGSSFPFGYNTGVLNQPKQVVQEWINESSINKFGEGLSYDDSDLIFGWVVSIFAVGGMVGGVVSGTLADRFGRKGGMYLNNIVGLVAAAFLGFSKLSGVYPLLFVGRFIVGINAGLNSALAPLYLTEISPQNLRGALGTVHQLICTLSILISMILGLPQILGSERFWPLLLALTAAPSIYQLIALTFCPESPKYTLLSRNNASEARRVLEKLRNSSDVDDEIEVMQEEATRANQQPKVSFVDMFRHPALRWPLFIAVMMMFSQQFSGINVAMYYSSTIFQSASLSEANARYATIGMGATNVLMTLVSTVIVDRFGRRTLHLVGMSGMWISSIALVICLATLHISKIAADFAIICVFLFVIAFATGPGSIPWFYVSEIFRQNARGHANSVAVVANWGANFIVGLIFLPLDNAIGECSFLVFTFCLTVSIIFTWKYAPETKGRSVEEISEEFATKQGLLTNRDTSVSDINLSMGQIYTTQPNPKD